MEGGFLLLHCHLVICDLSAMFICLLGRILGSFFFFFFLLLYMIQASGKDSATQPQPQS